MARVVNKPRLEPVTSENEAFTGSNDDKKSSISPQELMARTPDFDNLKAFVETILTRDDYENILTDVVETIIKEEQMALTEESKKRIKMEKQLIAMAFTKAVSYGDQQGLLYILSDRLGYRRRY